MMRSIAASMESSGLKSGSGSSAHGVMSGRLKCLELGDRLVGEPDLVDLAAMKHLHDDLEQPLIGDESVGQCAGAAQIIGSDGIGVAHHPHIHHPHAALDQHGLCPPVQTDKPLRVELVPIWDADSLSTTKVPVFQPEFGSLPSK